MYLFIYFNLNVFLNGLNLLPLEQSYFKSAVFPPRSHTVISKFKHIANEAIAQRPINKFNQTYANSEIRHIKKRTAETPTAG